MLIKNENPNICGTGGQSVKLQNRSRKIQPQLILLIWSLVSQVLNLNENDNICLYYVLPLLVYWGLCDQWLSVCRQAPVSGCVTCLLWAGDERPEPVLTAQPQLSPPTSTNYKKWNESGFRPPLCTYRLNWTRRTSWGWWDDWDDTVLQTQDSRFEPWRSEAEHATSLSRRLPTIIHKLQEIQHKCNKIKHKYNMKTLLASASTTAVPPAYIYITKCSINTACL